MGTSPSRARAVFRTSVLIAAVAGTAACGRSPRNFGGPRPTRADDPAAVARGEQVLLGRTYGYGVPYYRESAFRNLWKVWGLPAPPPDFEARFRERYGFHPAPYENGGLPMGMTWAREPIKGERGVTLDCMLCHGGSIAGKSVLGLPNTTLDMEQVTRDLDKADGITTDVPFLLAEVRGLNNADALAMALVAVREPDLSIDLITYATRTGKYLGWKEMSQVDTPPWWHWKAKKWLYFDGAIDARGHTSATFTLLGQFHAPSGDDIAAQYEGWRDVQAFIYARVEPPAYPLPVDEAAAKRGSAVYRSEAARCADCHGTEQGAPPRLVDYPTSITPLSQLGTDPVRYEAMSDAFIDRYNSISWFSAGGYKARRKSERPRGYVAPPLTGLWATAPYLHNGSVPTVMDLLTAPEKRPARYYRHPTTELSAYDPDRLGWKIVDCASAPCVESALPYPRMVFDTARRGLGNGGHTWGVDLTPQQKKDLIEFLKTI
jgi:mono/diheme cytochrome c family protein